MSRELGLPRVSIGMPVYNGAQYIRAAIDSVLNQTYGDLELIISDNASTDETQAICEEYAKADPRVRYSRNPRNLGAGPNYDRCFHLARGHYFRWAAHDDAMAPTYLEKAVAALDAAPDAVACQVGIVEIDEQGNETRRYVNALTGIDSPSRATRLGAAIHPRHQVEDFFSLYRRDAVAKSGLHDTFLGSDRVFLAEMALIGRWVIVPEPLFLHREHRDRFTRAVLMSNDQKAAIAWQDAAATARPTKRVPYHLSIYGHFWRLVSKHVTDPGEKFFCRLELIRWWFTDNHFVASVANALGALSPALLARARALKHELIGVSEAKGPGSLPKIE